MTGDINDLMEEIRNVDTHTRINGDRWTAFLDELAERYGLAPDTRPRLYIEVGARLGERGRA
jgi:hypothetical protein